MIDSSARARLHADLDRIIDRANAFTELDADGAFGSPSRADIEAHLIVRSALDLAAAVSGTKAHATAVGVAEDKGSTARISRCLQLTSRFIDPKGEMKPTIAEMALELRAIAAGDAPRLLAMKKRVKGRPINAYRRLIFQLRAFEWETLLASLGLQAGQRQTLIASAFGYPWDTIAKWKIACIAGLGDETVSKALYFARVNSGQWRGAETTEIQSRIDEDGAAYRAELAVAAGSGASSPE